MLENKEGQQVPQVTFRIREHNQWINLKSDEIFKNKKVILFALPGAYTPTCSSTHLPRYNELAQTFKNHGVDEIVCLSVNDTFVMNEWSKDQHAENVRLIPDGNGEFSEKMGMLVDKSDLGFGKRSWRYSMYVENGLIKKMFIEPEKPGDPFEVSDADTMLAYLAPEAKKPDRITLFTKKGCPHCTRAKDLLGKKSLSYEEIPLSNTITLKSLAAVSGQSSTPQVFINGQRIGGANELEAYLKKAA
ncbi:MAG: glutathione peroxidase [Deltaproteobacteria bacterium]|nr:glutathione peroxidase [Deltaproteobacteria bacterium]